MKSKVIKLANLDKFTVNPDYKIIKVTENEIQSIIESMASNLGKAVSVDTWEENSCVICKTTDGQNVLLYPSLQINGAKKASEDVKMKQIGDTVITILKDQKISLTIEQFLVNKPLAIDDNLAKACEIENVDTLVQLREHLMKREMEKKREENIRQLVMEYVQYMIEQTEVELDEAEVTEWCIPEAKRVFDEELSFGVDLRFTEDGQQITEEEALNNLAEELRMQFVVNMIQRKYGEENGFIPDQTEEGYGNPYDVYMYESFSERAKGELS